MKLYKILLVTIFSSIFALTANAQKEALLIGTFHFNNPGLDVVKTNDFDVMNAKSQKELDQIAQSIKAYKPDEIFVEWEQNDQVTLDSLYNMYLDGSYNNYVEKKYKGTRHYNFYTQSEIVQLAFRAARRAGLKKVYGVDYQLGLPMDSAITVMKAAKQTQLLADINAVTQAMQKDDNDKRAKLDLIGLIEADNTPESRTKNNGLYIKYFSPAGGTDNFAGPLAVSEWYRRNLYMYSLVQKLTKPADKRIMILLGSGHISMMSRFIHDEGVFNIVELKDIMQK